MPRTESTNQFDGIPDPSENPDSEPTLDETLDEVGTETQAAGSHAEETNSENPRRRRKPAHLAPSDDESAAAAAAESAPGTTTAGDITANNGSVDTPESSSTSKATGEESANKQDTSAIEAGSNDPVRSKRRFRLRVGKIFGWFTATESAAIAVLYAFVLTFFVYREIPLSAMSRILFNGLKTLAMVMSLIAAAKAFAWIMARIKVPELPAGAAAIINVPVAG